VKILPWVYILECNDKSYYTGFTKDLERRIAEHQNGLYCEYTTRRRPVKLVFSQETILLKEAFALERQIKGWSRKKKEAIIEGKYELLPELSKSNRK
jgi:putative endonuclease